jgi:hypothetical protein
MIGFQRCGTFRPIGVRDTFAPPVLAILLTECFSGVLVEELLWRLEPCVDIAEVHFWLASIDVNPGIRRNAHPGKDLEWRADPPIRQCFPRSRSTSSATFEFLIDREQDVGQRNSPFTYLVI